MELEFWVSVENGCSRNVNGSYQVQAAVLRISLFCGRLLLIEEAAAMAVAVAVPPEGVFPMRVMGVLYLGKKKPKVWILVKFFSNSKED